MGFLSHRVERGDLEAGDHLYTWRTVFAYSHHGIYVGENKVVHFTQDKKLSSDDSSIFKSWSLSSSSSVLNVRAACLNLPDCGFKKHTIGGGVIMSCLNCFLGNGLLYRFEYGASKLAFISKLRGGTCTTAKSDPPEAVVHRAMYLLHNGFGKYNLFTNNCEDFALYCKTGCLVLSGEAVGGSGQASSVVGVPVAAVASLPLQLIVSNPVVLCTTAAVTYTVNRYATDIGVRDDAARVKVEDIAMFHGDRDACPDEVDVVRRAKKRNRHN